MSTTIMRQYRYNYGGENYPASGWEVENAGVKVPLGLSTNQKITKLSISAPTGSVVAIGENNDFVIGSFETLEFNCNDIAITGIWLKSPISAVFDSNATIQAIDEGLSGMDAALTKKLNSSDCFITVETEAEAVNVLNDGDAITVETTTVVSGEDIETTLTNTGGTNPSIENTFLEEYTAAYNTYLSGIRGVWTASGDTEIKNILINVVIEETEASA